MTRGWIFLGLLSVGILHCSAGTSPGTCDADAGGCDAGSDARKMCSPNAYVFCRCPDVSEGVRLCNGDGSGYVGGCMTNETTPCPSADCGR
jgi:hypothetical protein